MQKKFRRLAAAVLCLTLLAVPALAAEATIRLDYVTISGEGFIADTFCGVDALYNETGSTLFCNELIERFYSAVYGVTVSFMCVYLALVLTPVILDRKEDRQWKSLQSET